jgi:hypothetical protein
MMARRVFRSPFDQYRDRNGQPCVVVGEVSRELTDDEEVGPLYRVRFDDGEIIEAYLDELADG